MPQSPMSRAQRKKRKGGHCFLYVRAKGTFMSGCPLINKSKAQAEAGRWPGPRMRLWLDKNHEPHCFCFLPWAGCSPTMQALGLHFSICKQGVITVLSSQILRMNKESRCLVNILVITTASPASWPQVRTPEVQQG